MKKLFAIIFSFQLIVTPVSFAAEPDTTASEQYKAGKQDAGNVAMWINQILSLSVGVVGSNILTHCKLGGSQPSIVIYFAGSLTYIGLEIWAAAAHQDSLNKSWDNLKIVDEKLKAPEGGDGELQLQSLNSAKDSEIAIKKYLELRTGFMTAQTVIFTAAAVAAIIELILSKNPYTSAKQDNGNCTQGYMASDGLVAGLLTAAYNAGAAANGFSGGGAASTVITLVKMVAALALNVQAVANGVSKLYEYAPGRIAVFGASAIMTGIIAGSTGASAGIAAQNINKLDLAITDVKKNMSGGTTITGGEDERQIKPVNQLDKPQGPKPLNKTQITTKCWSQTPKGPDYSSSSCRSPMRVEMPKLDPNIYTPTLSEVNGHIGTYANAIAKGDMEGAKVAASNINAMAGRIRKLKADLEKKANEVLKAKGEPTIDFNKMTNDKLGELQKMTANSLAAQGVKANTEAIQKELAEKNNKTSAPSSDVITSATVANVPAADISITDSTTEEVLPEIESNTSSNKSLDMYELAEEDVAKDKSVSIFKQLSNRYILNYRRIFKTEEESKPIPLAPAINKK